MNLRRARVAASLAVLLLTIAAFSYYIAKHPSLLDQLRHMRLSLLAVLLGMYVVFTVSLVFILAASLRIIGVRMPMHENFLLTSYSSIVNFFGPLQSGPGVRLVYLRKKYNVTVRNFMFATFLYYGFFALFSGLFLTVTALQWWQTAGVMAGIVAASLAVIARQRRKVAGAHFSAEGIVALALATLFQVLVVAVIYFTELRSVHAHVTFAQAMTYTGAANFALFTSLTPGAIGFRESFLLFSQRLHHIDSSHVLAASVIDRTVNVAFLGLLFLVTVGLHAQRRFSAQPPSAPPGSAGAQ